MVTVTYAPPGLPRRSFTFDETYGEAHGKTAWLVGVNRRGRTHVVKRTYLMALYARVK